MLRVILHESSNRTTPKQDGGKGKVPANKIDHLPIIEHINSFGPQISHYRREHAPNRKYRPSDLSVRKMFDSFKQQFTSFIGSYGLHRKILKQENISFVKLGHKECEDCEYFLLHNEDRKKDNLAPDCAICQQWDEHIKKADKSRTRYKEYAGREPVEEEIVFSVDLEKVIMLPRCDMFKNVIFSRRIIAYNESFVPVGTKQKGGIKLVAAIWQDVIAGRKKENVIITFYSFSLHHRDGKKIILWMDNCTAQKKIGHFFSFLVFIVNCEAVATERIEINYFEPGHTYMSADSFHHQVEMSLKRHGKVYDFADFKNAVQNANSSHVVVLEMTLDIFFEWQDLSSIYKMNKTVPRPYVKDIVQITVSRGDKNLEYKTDFNLPANNKVNGINTEKKRAS
ncbi:hypothetical protein JTB14_014593 [Gonioctena quinquepunctata]|nr:hypothetical protein JTB14_014593 [Gonioctena quinquepunctata]